MKNNLIFLPQILPKLTIKGNHNQDYQSITNYFEEFLQYFDNIIKFQYSLLTQGNMVYN